MPASRLTAVSALQQIVFGEDVKPTFDVVIDVFDQLIARRGFDGFLLLSRHSILLLTPALPDLLLIPARLHSHRGSSRCARKLLVRARQEQ